MRVDGCLKDQIKAITTLYGHHPQPQKKIVKKLMQDIFETKELALNYVFESLTAKESDYILTMVEFSAIRVTVADKSDLRD